MVRHFESEAITEMAFSHVEDLKLSDVKMEPWHPAGLTEGLKLQNLGEDKQSGALTGVLSMPLNWSAAAIEVRSAFELFVLDGEINVDGAALRAGHYCFRGEGDVIGRITATSASTIIARFHRAPEWKPAAGADSYVAPSSILSLDTWSLPWIDPLEASDPSEDYRTGVMVKMLRRDPKTGGTTHLAGLMPGWFMPGQEVHPVVEENYCLSGDVHIADVDGDPGYTMLPGSYLARPPGIAHGPIASKNGNVNLIFAHGPLGIDYVRHPDADQMIQDHFEKFAWM